MRSVVADSAVFGIGVAATPAAMVIATPIVARKLGTNGFGTVDVLSATLAFASLIALLGMDTAVARSYFDLASSEEDARHAVLRTGFVISLAVAVLIAFVLSAGWAIVAIVLSNNRSTATAIAGLAAFATLPLTNAQTIARVSFLLPRRRAAYVVAGLLQAFLGVALAIVLVLGGLGGAGYFVGLGLGSLVSLTFSLTHGRFADRRARWLDRAQMRTMLRYGIPLVPATAAIWIVFALDRALVASFRGFSAAGLYGLASKLTAPMMLAISAFSVAWGPFILAQPRERHAELRARALTAVTAATSALMICVVAFAPELVRFAGGSAFAGADRAVPGLTLGWLGWAAATVVSSEFAVARQTIVIGVVTTIAAVVNVVLNVILIPLYGFVAAAWVTAASFLLLAALYAAWERRQPSPARYRLGRLSLIAAITVVTPFVRVVQGSTIVTGAACAMAVCALAVIAVSDRELPPPS